MKTHKFVMYSSIYRDIVKQLAILSLCFQSDNNSINKVQIAVELTLRKIEKLKKENPEDDPEVQIHEDEQEFCLFCDHSLPISSPIKAAFIKDCSNVLSVINTCLKKHFFQFPAF